MFRVFSSFEAIQVGKNLNETHEMKGTHYHPPKSNTGGRSKVSTSFNFSRQGTVLQTRKETASSSNFLDLFKVIFPSFLLNHGTSP